MNVVSPALFHSTTRIKINRCHECYAWCVQMVAQLFPAGVNHRVASTRRVGSPNGEMLIGVVRFFAGNHWLARQYFSFLLLTATAHVA